MPIHNDRYSFPPMGAYVRPHECRLAHAEVRRGLTDLIANVESYFWVLKSVQEDFSEEERRGEQGGAVEAAMDKTWAMLGVLRGALSLFPRDIMVRTGPSVRT